MATDLPAIRVDDFFRRASWQCVRTSDVKAVAAVLDLPHLEPAAIPEDLAEVDPHTMPCLVVADGEWTWIFGNAMGLKGGRRLSTQFGEALAFHTDDEAGTHLAERALQGEARRRVYASRSDGEYHSRGTAADGEPRVAWLDEPSEAAELGLTSADVLHFARAWGVDPQGILTIPRDALWATRRAPLVEAPARSVRSRIASTLMFVVALALAVASAGVLLLLGQPEVAAEVCGQHPICATCVSCASAEPHPCASAGRECEEDEDCRALSECFTSCLGPPAGLGLARPSDDAVSCIDDCRDAHPGGEAAWCRFSACAYDSACAEACDAAAYRAIATCD